MKEIKTIVIVHVSEKYLDVAHIFFRLFDMYWCDCPYTLVVSCKGKINDNFGKISYQAPNDTSLPEDIYMIMKEYEADYCISLLGDAFITGKIDNGRLAKIIEKMNKDKIDYCRLFNSSNSANSFSSISKDELYGVSFIAFIASFSFVEKEFKNKTDYEFEMKFLNEAKKLNSKGVKWKNLYAVSNNEFNIVHGIVKGKWIKQSYIHISAILNNELYTNHLTMSLTENFVYKMRLYLRKSGIISLLTRKR